jgi:hypothetical protein
VQIRQRTSGSESPHFQVDRDQGVPMNDADAEMPVSATVQSLRSTTMEPFNAKLVAASTGSALTALTSEQPNHRKTSEALNRVQ